MASSVLYEDIEVGASGDPAFRAPQTPSAHPSPPSSLEASFPTNQELINVIPRSQLDVAVSRVRLY
jgi:hypothetical protein